MNCFPRGATRCSPFPGISRATGPLFSLALLGFFTACGQPAFPDGGLVDAGGLIVENTDAGRADAGALDDGGLDGGADAGARDSGAEDAGHLAETDAGLILEDCPAVSTDTTGPQDIAVIWVRFAAAPAPTWNADTLRDLVFSGTVQKFYREASFGKMCLRGQVFGPYTLPATAVCNPIGNAVVWTDVFALADADVNWLAWRKVLVVLDAPCQEHANGSSTFPPNGLLSFQTADGMFTGTLSSVIGSSHFLNNTPTPGGGARSFVWESGAGVIIHELGHSFGLDHANTLDCDRQSVVGNCLTGNYGSVFDSMSRAWADGLLSPPNDTDYERNTLASFHFGGMPKRWLGWIPASQVTETSVDGDFLLRPIERPDATVVMARFPANPSWPAYVLETRAAVGFDADLSRPLTASTVGGITIQQIRTQAATDRQQTMIDATPTDAEPFGLDWYNSAVSRGATWEDRSRGFSVENLGPASGGAVSVRVHYFTPECVRGAPLLRTGLRNQLVLQASAGATRGLSLIVGNGDSELCASNTSVTVTLQPPAGWPGGSDSFGPYASGQRGAVNFSVTVPSGISGTFQASLHATAGSMSTDLPFTIQVQ